MITLKLQLEDLLNKKSNLENEIITVSEAISNTYLLIEEHGSDYEVGEIDLSGQDRSILNVDINELRKKRKEDIKELKQQAKLELKEFRLQQKLALEQLKPKKLTKREILEAEFREKIRLEKELTKQKNNVPIEDIPKIIYADLNNFLTELKLSDEPMHYVVEQCSGLLPEKRTFESLAIELGRTRERNRQIYDKFFKRFLPFSRVSTELLKEEISRRISNLENLETIFVDLRGMFNDSASFYMFIEKLIFTEKVFSPFVKAEVGRGYYSNKIFDDYCINHKLPIAIDEAKKIISNNHKCNDISASFICFNLIDKNMVKLTEEGIIPLTPSIPAMIAQACLYFESGATYEDIRKKSIEIFNYDGSDRSNSEVAQTIAVDYIYLCEDGEARHLCYFWEEYTEEKINDLLEQTYEFLNTINGKSCRLKDLAKSCFNDSIPAYDLRYMIKKYGDKNPDKQIYFIGKSGQNIVHLNND